MLIDGVIIWLMVCDVLGLPVVLRVLLIVWVRLGVPLSERETLAVMLIDAVVVPLNVCVELSEALIDWLGLGVCEEVFEEVGVIVPLGVDDCVKVALTVSLPVAVSEGVSDWLGVTAWDVLGV